MHDPQPLAGERRVERFAAHVDVAEREVAELARGFVVIAGHVDDLGAFARFAQHFLHDVVVGLRPVPAFLQLPAVDDVADQVQVLRFVVAQEVEQITGLAAARAEMDIREPDRAIAMRIVVAVIGMIGVGVE
ncbi:hypothetical protein OKW34_006707 [Paraburkholderia youngii]